MTTNYKIRHWGFSLRCAQLRTVPTLQLVWWWSGQEELYTECWGPVWRPSMSLCSFLVHRYGKDLKLFFLLNLNNTIWESAFGQKQTFGLCTYLLGFEPFNTHSLGNKIKPIYNAIIKLTWSNFLALKLIFHIIVLCDNICFICKTNITL